jgi:2-polyprenyl-3-methyl-5-hydroxy-6-metoxy-1,4-benzoquinol methylase
MATNMPRGRESTMTEVRSSLERVVGARQHEATWGRDVTEVRVRSILEIARWGVDHTLSVGYGVVYDYIFEGFAPYRDLRLEVLRHVEAAVPASGIRRDVRILDLGCGPGNFSLLLGEAGFSVLGIDPYGALINLAREKRRAKGMQHVAFQHADVISDRAFGNGSFDQVVNVHSLYVHPAPTRLLRRAYEVLKPGGHGVFVTFTRRVQLWATFREIRRRQGLLAALRCLRWVLPNAIFEATRQPIGSHYWQEDEFATHLRQAGFTVLEMRRTFFDGVSLLAWVRKDAEKNEVPVVR